MKATINLIIIIVSAAIMTLMTAGCSRKTVTATQTVTESTATQQTQTVTATTVSESRLQTLTESLLRDFVLNIESTQTTENLDSAGNSKGRTVKNTRTTVRGSDRTQTTASATEDTITESNDTTVTKAEAREEGKSDTKAEVTRPPGNKIWWWIISAAILVAGPIAIWSAFKSKAK